ncbi:MAG: hypothetical protein HYZ94_03995 [Candidatus Omnitrophica bacterium]|nr:hypothetical protein [Candidatus Omnitrophota bacterium]
MTRGRVQQIIVISLLLAFGGVWALTRTGGGPLVTTFPPLPASPTASGTGQGPAGAVPPVEENPEGGLARDPFRPPAPLVERIQSKKALLEQERQTQVQQQPIPGYQEAQPLPEFPAFELQGVFWGTGRPQAIINRKIVSVGDTIDGAKVTSITKEGVQLTYGEREVELKPSTEIRREK